MCKCCGFKSNIHLVMSIFGLSISILEIFLSAVYNFHKLGFGMALMGLVASAVYLASFLKE